MATAGTVTIKLDGDSATLIRELNKANQAANSTFRDIQRSAVDLASKFAVIAGAAAAAFAALTKHSFTAIDALAKTADRLGITTEALATMQVAAELAGVDIEKLNKSLAKQQKAISDADQGLTTYARAFAQLGLSTQELLKLDADQQFIVIAEALNGVENVTRRNAIAMDIWGAKAAEMINFAREAGGGLGEMRRLLDDLNVTVSRFDASKIEQANDAVSLATKAFEGLGNTIAVAVAPYVAQLATDFTNAARSTRGFQGAVNETVAGVAGTIGFLGDRIQQIGQLWDLAAGGAAVFAANVNEILSNVAGAIQGVLTPLTAFLNTIANAAAYLANLPGDAGRAFQAVADGLRSITSVDLSKSFSEAADSARRDSQRIFDALDQSFNRDLPSVAIDKWLAEARANADAAAAAMEKSLQRGAGGTGVSAPAVDTGEMLEALAQAAQLRQNLETQTQREVARIALSGEQKLSADLKSLLEARAQAATAIAQRQATLQAAASGEVSTFNREKELAKQRISLAEETAKQIAAARSTIRDVSSVITIRTEGETAASVEALGDRLRALQGQRVHVTASLPTEQLRALGGALDAAREKVAELSSGDGVRLKADSSEVAALAAQLKGIEDRAVEISVDTRAEALATLQTELANATRDLEIAVSADTVEARAKVSELDQQIQSLRDKELILTVETRTAQLSALDQAIGALEARRQLLIGLDTDAALAQAANLQNQIEHMRDRKVTLTLEVQTATADLDAQIAAISQRVFGGLQVDINIGEAVAQYREMQTRRAELQRQANEEIRRMVLAHEEQVSQELQNIIEARAQAQTQAQARAAAVQAALSGGTNTFDAERALAENRIALANQTADALIAARQRVIAGGPLALPSADVESIREQTAAAAQVYLEAWTTAQQQRLEADRVLKETLFLEDQAAGERIIALASEQARARVLAEFQARGEALDETGQIADPAARAAFEQQVQQETLAAEADFLSQRLALQEQFGTQYVNVMKLTTALVGKQWADGHKKALAVSSAFASSALSIAGALFAENKAIGIANALVSTAVGVAKALELPFPFNLAAAAQVAAAGYAQVSAIRSTSVGGGGITGGISAGGTASGQVPASAEPRPREDQRQVTVRFEGDFYGWDDYVREKVISGIREAVDGRDVVIFSGNSRQAREVMGG